MKNLSTIENTRFIDIVAPVAPHHFNLSGVVLLIIFTVFLGFITWRFYNSRYVRLFKTFRRLNQLNHHSTRTNCNPRQIVFELAQALKQTLGITALSTTVPASNRILWEENEISHWSSFIQRLNYARFASTIISDQDLEVLIRDAKHWLRALSR